MVRVRAGEPKNLGREGVTRLHGRSVFHGRQECPRLAENIDPGEVDHDLLDEELQVRLGGQPVLDQKRELLRQRPNGKLLGHPEK